MRRLKIFLSALFVLAVAFVVARLASPPRLEEPYLPAPKEALLAVILDDWGYNYAVALRAFEIDRPLTLAVLPHLPYSKRIAEEAFKRRFGVMLHLPMEPKEADAVLQPHTIWTDMPDARIRRILDEALSSVPHAEGVNNHMGSAATGDRRVMRTVLSSLKARRLFFVDSSTAPDSVVPAVARELGIDFVERDVFIDNELNGAAIKNRLEEAKRIALKTGEAVVIGHDKKVTLAALEEAIPRFEREGIRFVYVRDLVKGKTSELHVDAGH